MNQLPQSERLKILLQIKHIINQRASRRPKWFEPSYGLCCVFRLVTGFWESTDPTFVEGYFDHIQTWRMYSGSSSYPIADPKHMPSNSTWNRAYEAARDMYHYSHNKYDRRTVQGRLRHELIDHLIACVRAEHGTGTIPHTQPKCNG